MRNIYYLLWVDTILTYKRYHSEKNNWQISVCFFLSWMQGLNLWIIALWLKYFNIYNVPLIYLDIFPGGVLNKVISFIIEFILPFGVANYLLIFYKNRYKKIIEKYKDNKIMYARIYSFSMISLAFISAILYVILTR